MLPLEWIYLQFEKGRTISVDDLRSALGENLAQQALLTLNFLTAQGMVSQSTTRGGAVYTVRDLNMIQQQLRDSQAGANDRAALEGSSGISERAAAGAVEILVVSAPLSLTGKLRALQTRYSQLTIEEMKEAFRALLACAQGEVLLSVPFLELDGLMVFVDEIKGMGKRHVTIKAMTRELVAPNRFDYGYYQKLRAFSKLIDLYVSGGGDPESVEVRDYTIKIGGPGDRGLIYEGIHQKMIVVDRTRAYVGSGEIRAPSFVVNGDVGVIQTGLAAEFWADYFLLFWSEAQKIDHQFFRSAQS
jgi:hypothetical protein